MSERRPEKRKVEFIESYWTGGEFGSDYKWNDNHGELIRCKDCKNWILTMIFAVLQKSRKVGEVECLIEKKLSRD